MSLTGKLTNKYKNILNNSMISADSHQDADNCLLKVLSVGSY